MTDAKYAMKVWGISYENAKAIQRFIHDMEYSGFRVSEVEGDDEP